MKILLIAGHGAGDSGALGKGVQECDKTRELVNLIAPKLRKYATVDVYDQSRNAYYDAQKGKFNARGYDYVLEVHFNAFNGQAYGTECYVTSREAGITVEQAIMKNLSKYFTLRDNDSIFDGVKRTDFLVINTAKSQGVSGALLETCFIDNTSDMTMYEWNKENIAQTIANGIAEGFGLTAKEAAKETTKKSTEEVAREVLAGKWDNGAARKEALTKAGYNYDEVQAKVNELCGLQTGKKETKKSAAIVASEIINYPNYGGWGTGATRKQKLTAYGGAAFAKEVQDIINDILS